MKKKKKAMKASDGTKALVFIAFHLFPFRFIANGLKKKETFMVIILTGWLSVER